MYVYTLDCSYAVLEIEPSTLMFINRRTDPLDPALHLVLYLKKMKNQTIAIKRRKSLYYCPTHITAAWNGFLNVSHVLEVGVRVQGKLQYSPSKRIKGLA